MDGVFGKSSVVVVGGGLAGLSAAIEAYENGADVTLLEKTDKTGGNSQKASSGINAVNTPHSIKIPGGLEDSVDIFAKDTIKAGSEHGHIENVYKLTGDSAASVQFLDDHGVTLEKMAQIGGHSGPRTHRQLIRPGDKAMGSGAFIMKGLLEFIETKTSIKIITNAAVKKVLTDDSSVTDYDKTFVTGVEYYDSKKNVTKSIKCNAVILATGGYALNQELLSSYSPKMLGLPSTNGVWSTGDGLKLAHDVGGDLIQLSNIQIHPTSFIDPKDPLNPSKVLAAEALRGVGGIMVANNIEADKSGKRFVNELSRRMLVSQAIFDNCTNYKNIPNAPRTAWLILDDAAVEDFGPNFYFYHKVRGFFTRYEDVGAFVESLEGTDNEIDYSVINAELSHYSQYFEDGVDADFGRAVLRAKIDPDKPIYVAAITPAVHYTMGGVLIDPKAQVLTKSLQVVQGLYAAGEVTGGVHGKDRLGGNSLLECVVFGREAGKNSAIDMDPSNKNKKNISKSEGKGKNNGNNVMLDGTPLPFHADGSVDANLGSLIGSLRLDSAQFPRLASFLGQISPFIPDNNISFRASTGIMTLTPRNTNEVSLIVRAASAHKIEVNAVGAGTAALYEISDESTAITECVKLDFSSLSKVISVDPVDSLIHVQSGARMNEIKYYLHSHSLTIPWTSTANPSIGGAVSMGTQGNSARHDMLSQVIELEVVLGNGEIINVGSSSTTHSTAGNLLQMFIGSEGTLGIITSVVMIANPISYHSLYVRAAFDNLHDLVEASATIRTKFELSINSMEMMNRDAIEIILEYAASKAGKAVMDELSPEELEIAKSLTPLPHMFITFKGDSASELNHIRKELERMIGSKVVTIELTDQKQVGTYLWRPTVMIFDALKSLYRESGKNIAVFETDTSIPLSELSTSVDMIRRDLKMDYTMKAPIVSHLGNNTMHLLIPVDIDNTENVAIAHEIMNLVAERSLIMGGSVVGDHGMGRDKIPFLAEELGYNGLEALRAIKKALDVNNVLNPHAVLPRPAHEFIVM
ncbi:Fumarate reductase 1 [Aduncisulcus paluster]|uniref:Fumarate reductase 1 n=1 Tax=Aduncisulcus paluster TaxID=2918883 RepID=A0ABQ5JYQ5_9EUKA|nr:Fumarate reductase 1 [Aduncisulcus paluster]